MDGIADAQDLNLSAYFQPRDQLDSPPIQAIPFYDPKGYTENFIHENTKKLLDFPDLSQNENELLFLQKMQTQNKGEYFLVEEVKQKPIRRKPILKKKSTSELIVQRECSCCGQKHSSKHHCEHTLCFKPCRKMNYFNLNEGSSRKKKPGKPDEDEDQSYHIEEDEDPDASVSLIHNLNGEEQLLPFSEDESRIRSPVKRKTRMGEKLKRKKDNEQKGQGKKKRRRRTKEQIQRDRLLEEGKKKKERHSKVGPKIEKKKQEDEERKRKEEEEQRKRREIQIKQRLRKEMEEIMAKKRELEQELNKMSGMIKQKEKKEEEIFPNKKDEKVEEKYLDEEVKKGKIQESFKMEEEIKNLPEIKNIPENDLSSKKNNKKQKVKKDLKEKKKKGRKRKNEQSLEFKPSQKTKKVIKLSKGFEKKEGNMGRKAIQQRKMEAEVKKQQIKIVKETNQPEEKKIEDKFPEKEGGLNENNHYQVMEESVSKEKLIKQEYLPSESNKNQFKDFPKSKSISEKGKSEQIEKDFSPLKKLKKKIIQKEERSQSEESEFKPTSSKKNLDFVKEGDQLQQGTKGKGRGRGRKNINQTAKKFVGEKKKKNLNILAKKKMIFKPKKDNIHESDEKVFEKGEEKEEIEMNPEELAPVGLEANEMEAEPIFQEEMDSGEKKNIATEKYMIKDEEMIRVERPVVMSDIIDDLMNDLE